MKRPTRVPVVARMLERDLELEHLDAAIEVASAGAGALVAISGPPGIGKTGLVDAARGLAAQQGLTACSARGAELERDLGFGGARQLLEPVLATLDPEQRAAAFSGSARLAEPVFDPRAFVKEGGWVGSDPGFSILHGLYWLCANLAQRTPLLFAVDDAHWLDEASLRFLSYLALRLDGVPIALVVAARAVPESGEAEELLERLRGTPLSVSLSPEPLSADAIARLLTEGMDEAPAPEFAMACRRATGGVPLYAHELIRGLQEEGIRPVAVAAEQVGEIGPPAVARYVINRVRRLAPGAEDLARAVAVLGADAAPHRAARMAALDDDATRRAIDSLVRGGVLRAGSELDFVHPMVRSAVYDEIGPAARSHLHKVAANLLEDEAVGDDRVAAHLLAAAPAGDPAAVDVLLRSGRTAAARGAPRSAAAYLRRALDEPPIDPAVRCAVVHELGTAEVHSGELAAGRLHLEEAYVLALPGAHRASVAQDLSGCLRLLWDHREAAVVIEAALDQLDTTDAELALSLRAELALLAALEPGTHAPTERRLKISARSVSGPSIALAKLEAALCADAAIRGTEPAAQARVHAAAARDAGVVRDLGRGGSLWINAVAPLVIADGFQLAERMIDEALEAGRERASVIFSARAYLVRALLRLRQGALADAQADAAAALDAVGDAGYYFALLAVSVLVECERERGDLESAARALERATGAGAIPDTFVHNWILGSRGMLRLDQGRIDEAVGDLEELGRRNQRRGQSNPAVHHQRSRLALALLRSGDADRARGLAETEVEAARAWGAPVATGGALRALGLCIGGEEGIAHLRESAAMLEATGARLEHAHSLVELGAALRRSGSRTEAREPLHAGMELAQQSDAAPLVERARDELHAAGARPRRIMRTGVDALTPSELRVARLAATGLTNREIAQALFVTARTVEGHLTHVFQKLDIESRDRLPQRLGG